MAPELISVLIPVYNVSCYVDKAISSILEQGYKNVEIIIIDDCSTDNTYEKCIEWSDKHSNIFTYKNEQNLRICKTLNKAYLLSRGRYILRLDGDDIASSARLKNQLSYLQGNALDLVGCQMIAIDESDNEISRGKMPTGLELVKAACEFASPIAHIWLAKREVYEALNGYRNIPYAEDYDFILRALDKGFRCDNSPEYLMLIRHRAGNTASTASLKQRKTHRYVLELHKRRLARKSDDDGFSEEELAKKIKSWPLTEKLHMHSTNLLSSAYSDNNVFRKTFKVILCCLLSYYNLEYLLSRIMFKRTFM